IARLVLVLDAAETERVPSALAQRLVPHHPVGHLAPGLSVALALGVVFRDLHGPCPVLAVDRAGRGVRLARLIHLLGDHEIVELLLPVTSFTQPSTPTMGMTPPPFPGKA